MEGGELFDRVADAGGFKEPLAKLLFYQMVQAVKVRRMHTSLDAKSNISWCSAVLAHNVKLCGLCA